MTKFEPTIKAMERGVVEANQVSLEPSRGEGADFEIGENSSDSGFMNREEALRELREIVLRNLSFKVDDDEIERMKEIVSRCDSRDSFLFLQVVKIVNTLKKDSFEKSALNFTKELSEILEEINSRSRSYLVKLWVDSILESPEKDWGIEQKEDFFRDPFARNAICSYLQEEHPEWGKYLLDFQRGVFLRIPNEDKEKIFSSFLRDRLSIFDYVQKRRIYNRFHVPKLDEKYELPPLFSSSSQEDFQKTLPKIGRIVSRASDKYGIVYTSQSSIYGDSQFIVEYFFYRNETLEDQVPGEMKTILTMGVTIEDMLHKEGFSGSDEEMKKLSELYQVLVEPFFRSKIEDEFLIRLEDFSVRTQVQFLNFLFEKNEEEVGRVKKFLQSEMYFGNSPFGSKSERADLVRQWRREGDLDLRRKERTDRLKSFLSLEQGGADMGERILAIGEKLPKEAADTVFAKYAEMVEVAEGAAEYVEKSLKAPEKSSPGVVARIAETLLVRAKNMLVEFSELDAATKNDLQALFAKLDSFRTDIELYKATLTAFARSGEPLGLDDMEQSRFESVSAKELSELDRGIMRDMYLRNIAGSPEKVRAKLLANLDQNFENPDTIFSVFRYENRAEGFLCFSQNREEKKVGEKFVSAFNVDPDFQKSAIGLMMFKEATNREAKNAVLQLECVPSKSMSARYIDEFGFVGTRFWDDEGEKVLDAVRDDREENRFHSKALSREEITARDGAGERENILVCSFEKTEDIPFDRYIGTYALTRYFFDAQKNRWFLAFEKSTKAAF